MKNSDQIPVCTDCFKFNPTFKHLSQDQLDQLSFDKSCDYFKRGEIVYREGNHTSGVFCINAGIIKLYKTGADGKEQIIRFGKKGDLVGYRSILSGELACTTAKVIEDASMCFIPAAKFIEMVKENSDFMMQIMQMSCKELGESNKFILDIAQKTVRERSAEVLLLLKDTFGLDEEQYLLISLTREEIANLVGTATESVIRLLSEFKSDRLIDLKGRKIRIIDERALLRISNFH